MHNAGSIKYRHQLTKAAGGFMRDQSMECRTHHTDLSFWGVITTEPYTKKRGIIKKIKIYVKKRQRKSKK